MTTIASSFMCRRNEAEALDMIRKEHEKVRRVCNAVILLCVPATILTYVYGSI